MTWNDFWFCVGTLTAGLVVTLVFYWVAELSEVWLNRIKDKRSKRRTK
jgi:uncharacterized protein (DUF2062 family)